MPVAYSALIFLKYLTSNWHLPASCQFTNMSELAFGCRLTGEGDPIYMELNKVL